MYLRLIHSTASTPIIPNCAVCNKDSTAHVKVLGGQHIKKDTILCYSHFLVLVVDLDPDQTIEIQHIATLTT